MIAYLKKRLALKIIKKSPAVSRFIICDKIRPHLKHFGLSVDEKGILFPTKCSKIQLAEILLNGDGVYREYIPYDDIINIEELKNDTVFYLRTGFIYSFSPELPIWEITNINTKRKYSFKQMAGVAKKFEIDLKKYKP